MTNGSLLIIEDLVDYGNWHATGLTVRSGKTLASKTWKFLV